MSDRTEVIKLQVYKVRKANSNARAFVLLYNFITLKTF